jgi:hypothetical protein
LPLRKRRQIWFKGERLRLKHSNNIASKNSKFNLFIITEGEFKETKLYFKLPQPGDVTIGIYDLQGREVHYAELTARSPYGTYLLEGDLLGSAGVYFVRVKSGDREEAFKVTYLP